MRILFTAIPTHSHIAPMLPLVESAVRAGHDVTFVTGAEGIPLVDRPGIRAVELGHTWAEATAWYGALLADTNPTLQTSDEALLHYIVNVFVDFLATGMAPGLIPLVADLRPDIIIAETAELASRAAAILAGVPHIVHGFGPQQSGELLTPVGAAIAEMQAGFGIPRERSRGWNDELYLDIWPAIVDDDSLKMFGNVLPIRPAVVSPALPTDPVLHALPFEQTVYVTLGTMFNTTEPGARALEKLVSVFAGEQVNAIVTVGRDGDARRFDPGSANVRVMNFVPQDAVLPYVDAVLSHGGAGTALGALAHGIPHVMTPVATDQHRIASRVAEAGAGIVLSPESSVQEIRAAVRAVIGNPTFADSARRLIPVLHAIPDADSVLRDILPASPRP